MFILNLIQRNVLIFSTFILGIFVRVLVALEDPFLHDWDERYHALVARNMVTNPLKPMLYKTMFGDYDFTAWCCNHIWLHKQPLFLWQIAMSLKLFGTSTFTLRLPSIIMGSLMILLVYRITHIVNNNKSTAFIVSLLMCFSYYQFNLISGRKGMDHNDIAFTFYVLCSI